MARVLIIDDSPTVIRFVQMALAQDGHDVRALDSFIQLAAVIREDPPDLVLLDLNIPALSGLTMGTLVRKYQSRQVPIIIYSSQGDLEMQKAAQALGAVAVLQKGADATALRLYVKSALGLAPARSGG